MNFIKLVLVVFLIGLFSRCENKIETNSNILLGYNEIYSSDSGFTMQIDSVLNDSRCPTGYECIWAGNAEIRFKYISTGNMEFLFNLNTNLIPSDTLIEEYRITMIKLSPYPKADELIEQKDYIVELSIIKE